VVFVLNLAKAMLRSGYYAPEHPGSKQAKEGIYADFGRALGDRTDVTLTSHETQGRFDVMISGILDDQVSFRGLIGPEQAEIYMPKLKDYFSRKNLVSFSLKRDLPLGHFEDFIDIMSDPKRDKGIEGQVGNLLTTALVEKGITEVSAVFIDDMIIFELKLPWRVEMAIQRLAKDLKVLPMFKDKTAQEIQEIKIKIIQDIIRPLREPHMLKDIVVNAHVIARNVAAVDAEDLEQTIVKTFPMEILIPTSKYVFEELGRIKEELTTKPDHKGLNNRFESVKRILKWISSRVIGEKIAAGQSFFEQLYFQKILNYDELPEEVKDHVNTMILVKEFTRNNAFYVERFKEVSEQQDVLLFLRFFRRILPPLLEQRNYDLISTINASVLAGIGRHPSFKTSELEHLRNPIRFIWKDSMDILATLFEDETKETRATIEKTVKLLGPYGVSLLVHVLMESKSKFVRRSAVEALVDMGDYGRVAMVRILKTPSNPWYIYRNALLAIGRLGKPEDAEVVDPFLRHENPRVREEALGAIGALEGAAAEPRLLRAFSDTDLSVRRRAVVCVGQLGLRSPRSVTALAELLFIEEEKYPGQRQGIVDLKVEAINALSVIGNESVFGDRTVQDVLLGLIMPDKKWSQRIVEKIKHVGGRREEDYIIQTAVLKALWRIGTPEALGRLSEFADKVDTAMVNRVKETIRQIQMRGRG
jgi:hypothetical protein